MIGKILIVDDEQAMCEMLEVDLRRRGFDTVWQINAKEAVALLREGDFDVLLTDLKMPGMGGIELCKRAVENRPDIPVIVMTAFGSFETAIAAMRAGAYDFVTKPVDLDILALILERTISYRCLKEKVKILTKSLEQSQKFEDLIGDSPPMQELYSQLGRIAKTETSVLILGETGTGKELVARALHRQSRHHKAAFTPINCSAMPATLLESELFGHKRGAFTDAKTDRKGLFLESEGGTLFLDEVSDIPIQLQPKLLRVLEERRLRPIGGNEEIAFDVRIIAATNRDLATAVEEGRFREDLFYRLNVIQVDTPPLRARGTDVLLLAGFFVEKFSSRMGKQLIGFSDTAAQKLLGYSWPGNVRELRNAIERAVALTRFDKIVPEDLPKRIIAHQNDHVLLSGNNPAEFVFLEEVERRYIFHVLKNLGGNRTLAARVLGLDRKTLYRKLKGYSQAH